MKLDSLFPLLLNDLPPELLAAPERDRLAKLATALPLASGGILELPISNNTGPAGWGVHLTQREGGLKLLEDPQTHFQASPDQPVWSALKKFAKAHQSAATPLRRAVENAWLEFDFDPTTQTLPPPGFFFKLEQPYNHPPTVNLLKSQAHQNSVAAIRAGLDALGSPATETALETLTRCIQARNASTSLAYVGVMLGRGAPGFRLVLAGMPLETLMAYLKKIEYAPRRGLIPLADFLIQTAGVERISLHLDIDGQVQPRLGLEVSRNPLENLPAAWHGFLGQLVPFGLATPARASAAPAWIRHFQRSQMLEKWPEALGRKYTSLHCALNHVKFTYQPGYFSQDIPAGNFGGALASQAHAGELSAKAYLAYQYAIGQTPGALWA